MFLNSRMDLRGLEVIAMSTITYQLILLLPLNLRVKNLVRNFGLTTGLFSQTWKVPRLVSPPLPPPSPSIPKPLVVDARPKALCVVTGHPEIHSPPGPPCQCCWPPAYPLHGCPDPQCQGDPWPSHPSPPHPVPVCALPFTSFSLLLYCALQHQNVSIFFPPNPRPTFYNV